MTEQHKRRLEELLLFVQSLPETKYLAVTGVAYQGDFALYVNQATEDIDPTKHSEIIAISSTAKTKKTLSLEGAALYCSIEPCLMCLGSFFWSKVSEVYFMLRKSEVGGDNFEGNHDNMKLINSFNRAITYKQVPLCEERMKEILSRWEERNRKFFSYSDKL